MRRLLLLLAVLVLAIATASTALIRSLPTARHADPAAALAALPGVTGAWWVQEYAPSGDPAGVRQLHVTMTPEASAQQIRALLSAAEQRTIRLTSVSTGTTQLTLSRPSHAPLAEATVAARSTCGKTTCTITQRYDGLVLGVEADHTSQALPIARRLLATAHADPALRDADWSVLARSTPARVGHGLTYIGRIEVGPDWPSSARVLADLDAASTAATDATLSLDRKNGVGRLTVAVRERGAARAAYATFRPIADRHGLDLTVQTYTARQYSGVQTTPIPASELR